jgi:hypothetical protein
VLTLGLTVEAGAGVRLAALRPAKVHQGVNDATGTKASEMNRSVEDAPLNETSVKGITTPP